MTGAAIIIEALKRQGITIIAGIPGGANLPLYDALAGEPIRHVLARHEQGAGFIAQGMARVSGKAAVCLATSGPGVMNLLTAIADAKLDSVPLVAITGQVPSHLIGTDAFQEVDTYGITMHMTKHNFLVTSPGDLPKIVSEAFRIAESGRKGPVLIDVPKDMQVADTDVRCWPHSFKDGTGHDFEASELRKAASLINRSEKPVILAGGGVIHCNGADELLRFARQADIPVAMTLMGLGSFPPGDRLNLGMIGMHGSPYANMLVHECDTLIALGVRFDDRATGKLQEFCPHGRIIHVDIDRAEIDKIIPSTISFEGDVRSFLLEVLPLTEKKKRNGWTDRIEAMKGSIFLNAGHSEDPLHPENIIRSISMAAPADALIATDVGQHQMWVAKTYPIRHPRGFLTSGGLGTMGFGLPASIGAALICPERRVICFTGDGSLQMNIQELATLAELDLNVTIIVMNNRHLGLVRQQQELFYKGNYVASRFGKELDFAALAQNFGIPSAKVNRQSDPVPALVSACRGTGPFLVDVAIDESVNALPMVPPGASNREMIHH